MRTKSILIESRQTTGIYNIPCVDAIIQRGERRILLKQCFGGTAVEGATYRWRHGTAVQLLATDTFETLTRNHEKELDDLTRAMLGYDEKRPILPWEGRIIAKVAESLGL